MCDSDGMEVMASAVSWRELLWRECDALMAGGGVSTPWAFLSMPLSSIQLSIGTLESNEPISWTVGEQSLSLAELQEIVITDSLGWGLSVTCSRRQRVRP